MRVVQINATYGYGSTGSIAADIHKMLRDKGHESYVFWATRCTEEGVADPNVLRVGNEIDHKLHAILRRVKNNQGWNSRLCTILLCKKLESLKPDIIHLHNLHSNYVNLPFLLSYLVKKQMPTVVTLHDCWLFTGHCTYHVEQAYCQQWRTSQCRKCPLFHKKHVLKKINNQYLVKSKYFNELQKLGVIGVSDWITECGRKSLLQSAQKICRIYNWIDCEIFKPSDNVEQIREKYGVPSEKKLVLGASQGWSKRKGLQEFREISEKLSDRVFVILVGDPSGNESTDNMKFIGYTNNVNEMSELYAAADLFVNPSRMETFGKVTAEALACGTPVVAYSNTGTAELVTESVGCLVADGNIEDMIEAVRCAISKGKSYYHENCRMSALSRFNKEDLLAQHLELYQLLAEEATRGSNELKREELLSI